MFLYFSISLTKKDENFTILNLYITHTSNKNRYIIILQSSSAVPDIKKEKGKANEKTDGSR